MTNAFKGHRKGANSRKYCVYTAYENKTDRLVCLDAEAKDAAEAMKVSLSSFFSYVARGCNKWTILKDFYDEIEGEE